MSPYKYYLGSSLIDAIDDRNLRDLEFLLRYSHADPNIIVPSLEMSPFHYISGNDSEEFAEHAAKLFISYGGNPNVRSEDGLTPVHIAASWGKENMFWLLVRNGGNPHLKDIYNKTAIDYAFEDGHADLVKDISCPNYQESEMSKINTSSITDYKPILGLELNKDNSEHNSISLPSSDENSKTQYVHDWCNKYINLEETKCQCHKEKSPKNEHKKRESLTFKLNERIKNFRKSSVTNNSSSGDNYTICKSTCIDKNTYFTNPLTSNNQTADAENLDEINKTIENLSLDISKTPNEGRCIKQENASFKDNISENFKHSIHKDDYLFISGVHPLTFSHNSDKSTFTLREVATFPSCNPNETNCSLLTSDRSSPISYTNFNNALLKSSSTNNSSSADTYTICKSTCIDNNSLSCKSQSGNAENLDEINKTTENLSLEISKTSNEGRCIRQENASFKYNISENCKPIIHKDDYSFISGVHPLTFSHNSDKSTFTLREGATFPSCNPNETNCSLLTSDRSSQISCADFNNAFLMTSDCSELNSIPGIGTEFQDNSDRSSVQSGNTIKSYSAEFEYKDTEKGIKFIERLHTPFKTVCATESLVGIPLDYDTDTLRLELTELGEPPGPITLTTKNVYIKKLISLKEYIPIPIPKKISAERVYPIELEKTLRNPSWHTNLAPYIVLEQQISEQFSKPDPKKKWREGIAKSSFTYLLLDPRLSDNLPLKNSMLSQDFSGFENIWKVFLSAIFYIGKGKRSRPFCHLYKTISIWNQGLRQTNDKKMQTILDIWKDNYGVVCLHIFQNVIPVEAYTREAAMIDAIGLNNLKNIKSGDYYGTASTWPRKQKRMLGVFLIYKALLIYLNEGERQLRPADIE